MTTSKPLSEALREWADVFMRRSMHETIRFWKESGLSMQHMSVLMRLHFGGACGVSEIGVHAGVTNAAASQMVDKLVQLGLLERTENPQDRRAKQLTLTPQGEALIQRGLEARRRWLEELGQALTVEQQAALLLALPSLTQAALDQEGEAFRRRGS